MADGCVSSCAYSSSVTGFSHSLLTSLPGGMKAMWENQESAFAPCQCLVPAGTRMVVPGVMLTGKTIVNWNCFARRTSVCGAMLTE